MVYVQMNYRIWPENIKEYEEIHKKEGIPCLQRHGVKVIGVWKHLIGGDTFEFLRIHAFENLADFEAKNDALHNDPDYLNYLEKIAPLHVSRTTSLLRPTEYSPLQ